MPESVPYSLLIDGQPVTTAATLEVINPATGQVFRALPGSRRRRAGRSGRRGPPRISSLARPGLRRAGRAGSHDSPTCWLPGRRTWSRLLTQEQGKPVGQSRDEIARGATLSVGMTKIAIGSEVILDNAERYIELRYQPLGVAGIITPWNAPVNLAIGPLTSALYTGNCAIIKPSPFTPLTTLRIGEMLRRGVSGGRGERAGRWR